MKSLIVALALTFNVHAVFQPLGVPFKAPVTVSPGFSAKVIFSNLTTPRGIAFDSQNNLLVVERGFGITAFSPVSTSSNGWERTIVIQNSNFTQGIQIDGTKLYASTANEALLYDYDPRTKSVNLSAQVIVDGFPAGGGMSLDHI